MAGKLSLDTLSVPDRGSIRKMSKLIDSLGFATGIINVPAGNISSTTVQDAINELDAEKQPLDSGLTALAAFNTNGLIAQTANNTFAGRTIVGTASQITVTNGNGVSGNPTLSLDATLAAIAALAWAQGDIMYSTGSNAFALLNKNTSATRYLSNQGTLNAPTWSQVNLSNGVTSTLDLATKVSGTLPLTNGGTGATSAYDARTGLGMSIHPPMGRLSLSTDPVMTSQILSANTVYYIGQGGDYVPVNTGTDGFLMKQLPSGGSAITLGTGTHLINKNYDVFLAWNGTNTVFGTGPAWTTDTTRADNIELYGGMYVNAATISITNSSGSTSIPIRRATYLGTIRCSANGETQFKPGSSAAGGGEAWIGVWNAYNRVQFGSLVQDSTASWTYNSATKRPSNNSTTMRISFIRGLDEDAIICHRLGAATSSANTNPVVGLGVDSTSVSTGTEGYWGIASTTGFMFVHLVTMPGLGWHYVQVLEYASGSFANTPTFYGNSLQSAVYY